LKHLLFTALSSALLLHSTAAWACESWDPCAVKVTHGEIPCVTISEGADNCRIIATLTCPRRDAPTLTLDNGQTIVFEQFNEGSFDLLAANPEQPARTITWTRDEERGEVTVSVTAKPAQRSSDSFDMSSCGDGPMCTATTPQLPAAPLTGLLPLMVGLLAWRRRTV
jgi:hypothetical protein